VGVAPKGGGEIWFIEESLDELGQLARTADAQVGAQKGAMVYRWFRSGERPSE
jgi:hypothetical protein